jgi:DNA primase
MFNAKQFFEDYNIPYNTSGKNTQSGWIQIKCPFHHDNSEHLGFNTKGDYFNCWHCGWFSIYEIIKKLLPNESYKNIKKQYESKSIIREKLNKKTKVNKIIVPGEKLKRVHRRYLKNRGFNPTFLERKYKLKGTNYLGNYNHRIIIPIIYKNKIVSYQGRDITNKSKQRYKACSKDKEITHHKDILYNLDNCKKDYIIVTEGIFKVFKLGDNVCCTFGVKYKSKQILLLSKYKRVYIFFDPDKAGQKAAEKLCYELNNLNVEVYNINGEKDPDEMTNKEVQEFLKLIKI